MTPAPPTAGSLVCSRWLQPEDFTLCAASDFDPPDVFPLVVDAVTDLLYSASGRQFPGICTDIVRPPAANVPGGAQWFGVRLADGSMSFGLDGLSTLPESTFGAGWSTGVSGDVVQSSGFQFSTVRLPAYPIVDVVRVTIDGVDLPDGSGPDPRGWLIVEDRYIVRRDGKSWPLWQRLDRPAGDENTWEVEYTFGVAPIPAGLIALQVLVCEFGKAWKGDKSCRLPKRLTQVTREGLSAVVIDPFQFLDKGRFGIYEVDAFLLATNPNGLSRDGKVINVDLLGARPVHVR